jgi:hypothetical protein
MIAPDAAPDARVCPSILTADVATQVLFHFEERSGTTAMDESGKNRHGLFASMNSTGPTWTTGRFGGGLGFTGAQDENSFDGDRVDVVLGEIMWGSTPFSVEAFLRPTADPSGIIVGAGGAFGLWRIDTQVWWRLNNSLTNLTGPTLPVDRWSYVAATYDGADMKLFVDGALVGTQAFAGSLQPSSELNVGCAPSDGCYSGGIDELRVSTTARSQAEISQVAIAAADCM